jgi:hypothetical protein
LTSQQSQASKYCELDKFTKQWENYQMRRTSTWKVRRTIKKGRIDETGKKNAEQRRERWLKLIAKYKFF